MSQKTTFAPTPLPSRRKPVSRLGALGVPVRRHSSSNGYLTSRRAPVAGGQNAQRTSKTTQKLVDLPLAPQTRPLPAEDNDNLTLGYETDGGIREYKNEGERMTKDQRKQAGFNRLTAYCVAESFKMNLLSSFLKREHNVSPRIFDKAMYAVRCWFKCTLLELPLTNLVDVPSPTPAWLRPKHQCSILSIHKKKDREIDSCSPFRGRRNGIPRRVLHF